MTNNNYNDHLFFSIWRNMYLKRCILNHVYLYNLVAGYCESKNWFCKKQLNLFRYPTYIKELHYYSSSIDMTIENDLNPLLFNIEELDDYNEDTGSDNESSQIIFSSSIEKLIIHSNDKLKVGFIPNSVKHLIFNTEFNQIIELGVIPNGVEIIDFQIYQNQYTLLPGTIPNTCKVLKFGLFYFNHNDNEEYYRYNSNNSSEDNLIVHPLIEGSIPDSVTILDLGNYNNKLPLSYLPSSLKELRFKNLFNHEITVPESLESLYLGNNFNNLITFPSITNSNLHTIDFGDSFSSEYEEFYTSLPQSLTHIKFGDSMRLEFPHPIFILSHFKNLKSITLSNQYSNRIPSELLPFIKFQDNEEFKNYGGI